MLDKITSFNPDTLTTPEVKPAADAVESLEGLATNFVSKVSKINRDPDLSDNGKAKLAAKARADFEAQAEELRAELTQSHVAQAAKVEKLVVAAREADKPAELGPDAVLEATLAMEGMKNLTPAQLVEAYSEAITSGDYIKRRAAEAVAAAVLKTGTAALGRFQALQRKRENPETPAIKAANEQLTLLSKLRTVYDYVTTETMKKGKMPFTG
ncbi:MAG: hypothetical protein K9K66_07625 [Desulfarculaceae bacterium]|nr:hypothetical protein [Desulfarculaceae bacterium]MCF8071994.1 hypothetical protein [Desulfarculaceae bacterium]MCF8101511.1 hypothetical protein [Desulfarculaceae bacterium]MCF8115061.1 hypothetical protein [Desulfarculaceae bacterium]